MSVQEYTHVGPALSVKFHNEYLFTCYGPYLHVYDYRHDELMIKCKIFHKNKIHGIAINEKDNKICAFGGKSVSIFTIEDILQKQEILDNELILNDWIISSEFSFDGDYIYHLTSYNKVLISDLSGKIIDEKALSNERSLLYSGTLKVLSSEYVLVNAGTVMGGVIIWDMFKEEMKHNLTGHEGSIFYVSASNNGKLIASCSDDRSIRLWDNETGNELSVGWSHTARIWNLKFFNDDKNLISVSEDCTCRVWNIIEAENGTRTLEISNVTEGHLTKNVWGVDVSERNQLIATSGNDGRIRLIDLKSEFNSDENLTDFSISDIEENLGTKFDDGEIIKGFFWFSFGLVAITSIGRILGYNKNLKTWSQYCIDNRLTSYSLTQGIYESNIVLFSNNKCSLLVMKFSSDGGEIVAKKAYHETSLSKLSNCIMLSAGYHVILMESPNPKDKLIFWNLDDNLDIKAIYHFNKPENFVTTCLEVYDNFYLVGSRFSSIGIFNIKDIDSKPTVIRKINNGDSVTTIKLSDLGPNFEPIFAVTNRDGFYDFIKISFKDIKNDKFYTILHSNKLPKGFLEGSYLNSDLNFITYGFKSSLFYIYNETSCYEIGSQNCGGAHRQWHFSKEDPNCLILAYIKASNLYIRKFPKSGFPLVLDGGLHGREIRDVAIMKDNDNFNGYFFCTGSEDTTIKLSYFEPTTRAIKNYWTERKHVSGLQRLKAIKNDMLISSSAREELFLWKLTYNRLRPYITCVQSLPTSSKNPDLRIMDFSTVFLLDNKGDTTGDFLLSTVYSDSMIKVWLYNSEKNSFFPVIEGVYKTCCILNTDLRVFNDQMILSASATDGHLFGYDITNQLKSLGFKMSKGGIKAPLKVEELKSSSLPETPSFDKAVHQSGIKSFSIMKKSKKKMCIITGGDDNALALSTVTIDKGTDTEIELNFSVKDASSSTITSVNIFKKSKKTRVLTTSVDQVIKIWSVEGDKLTLLKDKYTTVADTGCADLIKDKENKINIVVGGVGLSVFAY
ncbi:hypothetical protein RNJ44_02204 [Nakaseomyces bracarensis]|uniref:Regulator of Ty1 transposition protein 10 n=1 Tax=Nakaseomyces bracarensis TaxID=273131 RepID=A0ABR4NMT5_9SACH